MKLKKILTDLPLIQVKGSKEIEITGICANSKQVSPGNLFIAKKGKSYDGTRYINEAVKAGAKAVVTDIYDPFLKDVVQIIHPNVAAIEASITAQFYQYPSDDLLMIGITGTNGKTTTSFIIKYLLDAFQGPCGLIGTVEYLVGRHRYEATRTTPDVSMNQLLLREMVKQSCRSCVMEVTSHALDQGRVDKIDFDVAIFSNLSLDHLDYHKTMEQYCLAKSQLFKKLGKEVRNKSKHKVAVINSDSPWSAMVSEGCQGQLLTYSVDAQADLKASDIFMNRDGTSLNLHYQNETYSCSWPLIGRFNVYNCLAAIGAALACQFPIEAIIEKMTTLPPVRGRLEPVKNSLGYNIYVDFAHSDDALKNVLECLKELNPSRIITVFGCGGDRDQTKRPKMAEACETYSDVTIVTSDNPRSESPEAICQSIIRGFKNRDSYIVEIDRRLAIEKAIEMASPTDIILIAGKGHETYQIFAHQTIEFDDCKVAAESCAKKESLCHK